MATPLPAGEKSLSQQLDELSAPQSRVRLHAAEQIMTRETQTLAHLPAAGTLPTPGANDLLERIRLNFEQRRADDVARPHRIAVEKRMSVSSLFTQISNQCGWKFDTTRLNESVLGRQIESVPEMSVWKVLSHASQTAQFAVRGMSPSGDLILIDRPEASGTVVTKGIVRSTIMPARTRRLGDGRRLLTVTADLLAEPSKLPVRVQWHDSDSKAIAGQAQLKPWTPDARRNLPWINRDGGTPLTIRFVLPADIESEAVLDLSLPVTLTYGAGQVELSIPRIAESDGAFDRVGHVALKVQDAQLREGSSGQSPEPARLRVEAAVRFLNCSAELESHTGAVTNAAPRLSKSSTQLVEYRAVGTGVGRFDATLIFEGPIEALRTSDLEWSLPQTLVEEQITIEAKIPIAEK
ncbi:hypothetical protein [Stratiformator vulcanicus]|uniref:hypothetical protein n=1 Tax=Stratiformator vulcanicus TaxID=2527980 RepID=UPI00119DC92B|nr:hypothetical protein [Stratiformator vulcanicus]